MKYLYKLGGRINKIELLHSLTTSVELLIGVEVMNTLLGNDSNLFGE